MSSVKLSLQRSSKWSHHEIPSREHHRRLTNDQGPALGPPTARCEVVRYFSVLIGPANFENFAVLVNYLVLGPVGSGAWIPDNDVVGALQNLFGTGHVDEINYMHHI